MKPTHLEASQPYQKPLKTCLAALRLPYTSLPLVTQSRMRTPSNTYQRTRMSRNFGLEHYKPTSPAQDHAHANHFHLQPSQCQRKPALSAIKNSTFLPRNQKETTGKPAPQPYAAPTASSLTLYPTTASPPPTTQCTPPSSRDSPPRTSKAPQHQSLP